MTISLENTVPRLHFNESIEPFNISSFFSRSKFTRGKYEQCKKSGRVKDYYDTNRKINVQRMLVCVYWAKPLDNFCPNCGRPMNGFLRIINDIKSPYQEYSKKRNSLRNFEKNIEKKLKDINQRLSNLTKIHKEASLISDSENSKKIIDAVEFGIDALNDIQAKFLNRMLEIDLIRWHNQVITLIPQDEKLDYNDLELNKNKIKKLIEKGENHVQKFNSFESLKNDQLVLEKFLKSISSTKKILVEILAKQASLAVKGMGRYSFNEMGINTSAVNVFNEIPNIGSYSKSLEDLELEYMKLELNLSDQINISGFN